MYKRVIIERKEEIEAILDLIDNRDYYKENSENGLSILVNGSWGSGKTTFIKQLLNNSEMKKRYNILKYDAFEYDFYENPFIPLFSFLYDKCKLQIDIDRLTKITSKHIGKVAAKSTYMIVKTFFHRRIMKKVDEYINELKDIKNESDEKNSVYQDFKSLETTKKEIKEKLQEITNAKQDKNNKPIVLIIDELDRCNPTFAIGTLEILKYFLDIKNVIIILSLDEKQLQESAKTIYGQGMNSDIYFSKFFDYKFNLNPLTFSMILDQSSIKNKPDIMSTVDHMYDVLNISPRDGHKIFIEFLKKYEKYNKTKQIWTIYQYKFIFIMIIIKNTDIMFYNSILNSNYSNFMKIVKSNDNVDKKKYIETEKYTIEGKSNFENCVGSLINFFDTKYVNKDEANNTRESLAYRDISWFLPRVLENKTYKENFLEILNK